MAHSWASVGVTNLTEQENKQTNGIRSKERLQNDRIGKGNGNGNGKGKGKEWKGKERKGKERKVKERKGKERKGKERKGRDKETSRERERERERERCVVSTLCVCLFVCAIKVNKVPRCGGATEVRLW